MKQCEMDISGEQFGMLTAIKNNGKDKWGSCLWLCKCSCGEIRVARISDLFRGDYRSCGCARIERVSKLKLSHGFAVGGKRPPELAAYYNSRQRCNNPKYVEYRYWGGRGIKFLFKDFEEFLQHLGPRPSQHHSVDRINNEGNYEPGNVRWATPHEQCMNKRPKSHT
jgi:hypothetical protein